MNRQLEREEDALEKQLANGEISLKEFNAEMRALHRGIPDPIAGSSHGRIRART